MNEEILNLSIRAFLKNVGIKSQREIEHCVAKAIANKKLKGNEELPVSMTLKLAKADFELKFEDVICLE